MNAIAIIAAIIGALAGFGIVYANLKKVNQGMAIGLGVLSAGIGAIVVRVFLSILILAILVIIGLGLLLPYIFE